MLTTIPEVDLGIKWENLKTLKPTSPCCLTSTLVFFYSAKLKNIEATERARATIAETRAAAKAGKSEFDKLVGADFVAAERCKFYMMSHPPHPRKSVGFFLMDDQMCLILIGNYFWSHLFSLFSLLNQSFLAKPWPNNTNNNGKRVETTIVMIIIPTTNQKLTRLSTQMQILTITHQDPVIIGEWIRGQWQPMRLSWIISRSVRVDKSKSLI